MRECPKERIRDTRRDNRLYVRSLGALIGVDILNLPRIRELGAPVVSIGGAGTFDGIFPSGIIAAFIV